MVTPPPSRTSGPSAIRTRRSHFGRAVLLSAGASGVVGVGSAAGTAGGSGSRSGVEAGISRTGSAGTSRRLLSARRGCGAASRGCNLSSGRRACGLAMAQSPFVVGAAARLDQVRLHGGQDLDQALAVVLGDAGERL